MAGSSSKNGLLLLLLLVAGAGGVGAWNYQRHAAEEAAEYRPFKGYATADLDKLIAAQRSEIARLRPRAAGARAVRADARSGGLIGDQVREFERVQRHAGRSRELSTQLTDLEVMLDQLEKERAKRGNDGESEAARVLRLAFTF